MSRSATVYVSSGATVDEVRAAVDAYTQRADSSFVTDVEFGDEYPGYDIAVDVYRRDDPEADARQIAAGIAPLLPGRTVAVDVDIQLQMRRLGPSGQP